MALDRNKTVQLIRQGLRELTGKPWAVTNTPGTDVTDLTISSSVGRRVNRKYINKEETLYKEVTPPKGTIGKFISDRDIKRLSKALSLAVEEVPAQGITFSKEAREFWISRVWRYKPDELLKILIHLREN